MKKLHKVGIYPQTPTITGHEVLRTWQDLPWSSPLPGRCSEASHWALKEKKSTKKWEILSLVSKSGYIEYFSGWKKRVQLLHLVYNLIITMQLIHVALQRSPRERKNKCICSFFPIFDRPVCKPFKQPVRRLPAVKPTTWNQLFVTNLVRNKYEHAAISLASVY